MSSDSSDDSKESNTNNSGELYRDWPHQLTALQTIGEEIIERWEEQNPDSPRDFPTQQWLIDNGYAHLRWILNTKHDMGVLEFFVSLTSAGGSEEYDWHITDVATIERAKAFLDDRQECRNWVDRTFRTHRSRLNSMLRKYAEACDDEELLSLAQDQDNETAMYEAAKQVIKDVRADQGTGRSAYQYMRALHGFFEWLDRSGRIAFDPLADIEEEFRWDDDPKPEKLSDQQVRDLWKEASTPEEHILVLGYCVWGLRTAELPAIHRDQLNFEPGDPKIEFGESERKNGIGSVSLLFGLNHLAHYLEELNKDPDWNGFLFPSEEEDREHLCARTMRLRFKELCRQAGVRINNEPATPGHGRTFYYNLLGSAETQLLKDAAEIAEEQGSIDPETVIEHYLTAETKDEYRRVFFRNKIREILPDDAYGFGSDGYPSDTELGDF